MRYEELARLRRGVGKGLDRGEAKDALFSTFNTLFDLLDHIAAMRDSMQRMELYLLVMVLIIGVLTVVGLLGGLGYVCSLLGRVQGEKTVVVSRTHSFDHARSTKAVLNPLTHDAKL